MSRKCKVCKNPFTPVRPMQSVCCPACAMVLARNVTEQGLAKARAKDRKETREKLEKMKTRSQHIKECQVLVAVLALAVAVFFQKPHVGCAAYAAKVPGICAVGLGAGRFPA